LERSPLTQRFVPSPNIEPRSGGRKPDMLLLHYTGMAGSARAIDWLTRPESKVSCHYLIDEHGGIVQMVDEGMRAWHAGLSSWHGETDNNSRSIGIEIHNVGYDRGYPDFPEVQMRAVDALCVDICTRHGIAPAMVVGHSDIAPGRKIDPGHKFDWARLARLGCGLWVPPAPITLGPVLSRGAEGEAVRALQAALKGYGFGLDPTGVFDARTEVVVAAFQRHWRPESVDGVADPSTLLTLSQLIQHAIDGAKVS
jgi:N-acetylmuramoyl-L-alanine amidase